MIAIIILVLKILLALFITGYSLACLFELPFWLSPWLGTVYITVFGVILSLGKVPMNQAKNVILLSILAIWVYGLLNKRIKNILKNEDLFLFFGTLIILIINLIPLFRVGYPTTISLSNLDAINYSTVADFFRNHTVFQGSELIPFKPYLWSVGDLVHYSFRWGSPMLLSFFASLLKTRTYQIFYLTLVVFFSLGFPLVYLLTKKIAKNDSKILIFLIFLTYGINSTMMYVLYNVFFAQIVFIGLFVLLLYLIFDYLEKENKKDYQLKAKEFLIAAIVSAMTTVYPEGLPFFAVPLLIFIFLKLFDSDRIFYLVFLIKLLIISCLINPVTFGTAVSWGFKAFFGTLKIAWIGWEKLRFASPAELLGIYNFNFSRDLPLFIKLPVNLIIIFVLFIGFEKIKNKLFFLGNFILLIGSYLVYRFIFLNYYTFFKSATYSLFLLSIFFSIGFYYLCKGSKKLLYFFLGLLMLLSIRSSFRTFYQMYFHYRVVDKSLISLQWLNDDKKINQVFYTSDVFLGEYDLWKRLWREYFLMDKDIVSRQNISQAKDQNIGLVLSEKNLTKYDNKEIIYKKIIWENDFYQLGEIEKK